MISKQLVYELLQASALGLLGCSVGFMTMLKPITGSVAIRYLIFAIAAGPVTYHMLNTVGTYSEFRHIGAIFMGYAGFFLLKGFSILLFKFSVAPEKLIESITGKFKK